METLPAGRPPIKIGGESRPPGKGPHTDVEVRVAYSLVHAETLTKFLDAVTLHELRVTSLKDGYRVMLKGERKGQPRVAYFRAASWREAVTLAATSLDCGHATWYEDEWPIKR